MAEHDEHPPAGGAVPASRGSGEAEPPAAEADPATRPAASESPPPHAETLDQGAPPRGGGWSGRARRWSGSGAVRLGAVAIAAGLVGGLVGGGIVAAFSDDDGPDRAVPMRFERHMQRGGPGWGGPRYWGGQPPYGWMDPRGVPQPGRPGVPVQPAPVPSPTASG
jgi:hypothetical protein